MYLCTRNLKRRRAFHKTGGKNSGDTVSLFLYRKMAITKGYIRELVEKHLEGTPLFLVDVLVKPGNLITIILDGNESVTIDDCVSVSRFTEKSLDRDVEDFELKVMSAGADSPFRNEQQYRKNIGKKVRLLLEDNEKLEGKLMSYSPENVVVEIAPKMKKGQKPGKNREIELLTIPLSNIKEAKLVITF